MLLFTSAFLISLPRIPTKRFLGGISRKGFCLKLLAGLHGQKCYPLRTSFCSFGWPYTFTFHSKSPGAGASSGAWFQAVPDEKSFGQKISSKHGRTTLNLRARPK